MIADCDRQPKPTLKSVPPKGQHDVRAGERHTRSPETRNGDVYKTTEKEQRNDDGSTNQEQDFTVVASNPSRATRAPHECERLLVS